MTLLPTKTTEVKSDLVAEDDHVATHVEALETRRTRAQGLCVYYHGSLC